MVPSFALNAYLVDTGHFAVHDLPFPASLVGLGRCICDCIEYGVDLIPQFLRQLAQEIVGRNRFAWIVGTSTLKEVNEPRNALVFTGSHSQLSGEIANRLSAFLLRLSLSVD